MITHILIRTMTLQSNTSSISHKQIQKQTKKTLIQQNIRKTKLDNIHCTHYNPMNVPKL